MLIENSQKMLLALKSKKMFDSYFLWNFRAVFHGRGVEFKNFREYQYSDDAKYIDWLQSSSQWTTIMRNYSEEKQWNVLLCIDMQASLEYQGWVKREVYKQCITLLWYSALSTWELLWGYIFWKNTQYVPLSQDRVGLEKLYNLEEGYASEGIEYGILAWKKIPTSIVFILSEALKPDISSLKIASKKHDIVYIHVSSYFENTLSGSGVALLWSTQWSIAIDLDNEQKKKKYIIKRNKQKADLKKDLYKIWVQSIFLDETSHITEEFLKLMKQREY